MPSLKHLTCLLACLAPIATFAASPAGDDLEDRAQSVKTEVLDLEAEFTALARDIRYPAPTRWTVFVTAEALSDFELETIELSVDDTVVATHRYDGPQRDALADGGAHRLHIDNLASGDHRISARLTGRLGGEPYARTAAFRIDKPEGPRLLELHLHPGADGGEPTFTPRTHADRP
ncbi:AraC family transcriptional regulator [Salinisphaera sp. PC39]|uniref:hypothetical protein n=1 Tax=Salinisphaera sp. PC39 TaxID=1304156 RepID=UPI0033419013